MVEGFVKVEVSKTGYAVSGNPRTVAVHTAGSDQKTATTVYFSSLSADGSAGSAVTKNLTLTFSQSVSGLTADDIYLNPGVTGAKKGNLSGSGPSYDLGVTNITDGGIVSVTVTKTGYAFKPTTQRATVYSGNSNGDDSLTAVTLTGVTANGESSAANTTQLTLTFDNSITGLTANHITITSPNRTTVKNGDLTANGSSYTLPVSVTKEETVTVAVSNPEGYVISDSSPSVPVYYYLIEHTDNAYKNPSIKAKFMIDAEGTDGVTAAFNALSAYIKTDEFSSANNVIKLGDWIDLEGGLTVDKYLIHYAINMGNTSMYPTFAFEERMMLRLIVVGINSFKNLNGNDNTPHVVFHFQNVPLSSLEMNVMNKGVRPTNAGGYPASTLRRYLTPVEGDGNSGKFLAGLKNAGVLEEVL
jgi:hypothetical protein